ncbi:MAG: dihydroneopterin aldolase [Muribaculaceae bacterium]|nr:dihydroneopterin aldolase [Muribaculaceae bacterium]MDE6753299.1 dihydroneopterin aldolase [Muribaculaceae bacterium]
MEFEISLNNLLFHSRHGVFPQETIVGNVFVVDISVRIPFNESIAEDKLDSTVSYADIFEIISEEMNQPRKLLETVALSIKNRLLKAFPEIKGGKITICKSQPPIAHFSGNACVSLIF